MQKKDYIHLNGQRIAVVHRLHRSKVQLEIKEAVLYITSPVGIQASTTTDILEKKTKWIVNHIQRQQAEHSQREDYKQKMLQEMQILGKPWPIEFKHGKKANYAFGQEGLTIFHSDKKQPDKTHLKNALNQMAKKYLPERVGKWAAYCRLRPNTVMIRGQKTRWGSCSSRGNINLNQYLMLLPQSLSDYVIVHELCHLKEMNHSPRFWKWVERYCPDYKNRKKDLNSEQWLIRIYD